MKSASLLKEENKMTKNIHDVAYELQKAIAENDDFKTLKESLRSSSS